MRNFNAIKRFLFIVFFLSGISGLIYETVWLRVLSRILGSTVQASSITISAFMLGLTIGSYYISKRGKKISNEIRTYALIEIGIAITAIVIFLLLNRLIPVYQFLYRITDNNMFFFRLFQTIVLFVLLIIPTFLMGVTLPILSSGMLAYDPNFTKNMGYLYGLNTLGAVAGVFISAFITLGTIGEFNTILVGCAFNLIAGIIVLIIASTAQKSEQTITTIAIESNKQDIPLATDYPEKIRKLVLIAYMLIGFTSFAIEVVWIRLFQLTMGTAIYSFSIVMIFYLTGSALGSYSGARLFKRLKNPIESLGILIMGIGLYIIIGLYLFTEGIPWYLEDKELMLKLTKIIIPPLIIFPVTFLVGFIFPCVTRIYVPSKEKITSRIGKLYASNTLGCIFGSIICGYIFIPYFGTRSSLILISVFNLILGSILLFSRKELISGFYKKILLSIATIAIAIAAIFSSDPFLTVINKYITNVYHAQIWFHKETSAATITVSGKNMQSHGDKALFINGTCMSSLCSETKIMAHLPLFLHPHPKNMLVICYGMGTCLRSAVTHPDINIDVVELIGEEYNTGKYFHSNGQEVLANKRVHAYTDDGRNFLLLHDKQYDVISIDPAPPLFSAGTVNIYTRDFFQLCKKKLTEKGILCLWIPPANITEVKMIMKSFQDVFPTTDVYCGPYYRGFYMMGYASFSPVNIARFDSGANNTKIMADLNEWDSLAPKSPSNLLKLKLLTPAQLASFTEGSPEVTDNYPYTEFPLWRRWFSPEYKKILDGNYFDSLSKQKL